MNRKFFIFYLLFSIIVFSSCSKKEISIPRGIISKQEMVSLLVDLHIAQAATSRNQMTDSARHQMKDYTPFIFSSHQITKEQYDNSLAFYTKNPELLDEIYDQVINELSRKQSEIERK